MKVKTSITLSKDVLRAIDERAEVKNRSEFIETALRAFLTQVIRNERNARDLRLINDRADALNREALDVLDFQVKL
jgi:metal-responsive CopG/Arc/MetJ family transcriptional regulator